MLFDEVYWREIYWREINQLRKEGVISFDIWLVLRQYSAWRKSLEPHVSPIDDHLPWITFSAIEFLESFLHKDMLVYEYGSGGSTLFFAERIRKIISCEHDTKWASKVLATLETHKHKNYELNILEPSENKDCNQKNSLDPDLYQSSSEIYQGFNFRGYVTSIDSFPERYFDLILIDGRARPSCCKHALPKVKEGGYIMLDNSERPQYKDGQELLNQNGNRVDFYGPGPYNRYFWQTSIWQLYF